MSSAAVLHSQALCEPAPAFLPCEFRIRWAAPGWEQAEARRLRRAVFCVEQGIFVGDDCDAIDGRADGRADDRADDDDRSAAAMTKTIVAVSCVGGMADQVVGTVRIHAAGPGLWWGSRLAVHPAFRRHGGLGAGLIRLAVSSAQARGAAIFLAHVQSQNVDLFRRLHWTALREENLHGRPHHLMQADLSFYPVCHDPLTGFVTRARASA